MAFLVKNREVLYVTEEDTAGTYKAPVDGTEAVQTLDDGAEITYDKELKERNVMNSSLGKSTPRPGMRGSSATIPVEFKAGEVEGAAPEYDSLLKSLLGTRRQVTATTTATGHTVSTLELEVGDGLKYEVGDVVMVKEAGAYHESPISAIVGDQLGLLVAADAPFSDNVEIAALTKYTPSEDGQASLSLTQYLDDKIARKSRGNLVSSCTLEGFETGELASLSFSTEALDFVDEAVEASGLTPDFESSRPPLILSACVYQDGQLIQVNSVSLAIEQAIGTITSTCSEGGKIANRITERTITGSINPFKSDTDVTNFTKFKNNEAFSLFFFAANPTTTTGEKEEMIAVYLPNCISTSYAKGDQDGITTDEIEFSADRGDDGQTTEIHWNFI